MKVIGLIAILQIGLSGAAQARVCPGLSQDSVLAISGTAIGTRQAKLVEFTRDDVAALAPIKAVMERPWEKTPAYFKGPLLAQLISASGISGKKISIRSENNYSAELSIDQAKAFSVIAEMNLDGVNYAMRGSGPLLLLHAMVENSDVQDENFESYSIWKVCKITIH